jgi:hypothetical protein
MSHKFFSVLWRDVRRYWWIAALALVWKLLEHWALGKADEYIGAYIGNAVKNANAFLHVDATIVVLALVLTAILLHAVIEAREPSTSDQTNIYEIRFDYLPGNLLDNGWVRAYPRDTEVRPKATLATDVSIAGSIKIDAPDGHAYDYRLPRNVKLADHLVFAAKYTPTTMIFTEVQLSSKDESQTVYKWIKYEPGKGSPRPTKGYEDYECTFPVAGEPLQSDWRKFTISLPDVVEQTWGKHGLIFRGVTVFRVRGSLGISPIEFYESL